MTTYHRAFACLLALTTALAFAQGEAPAVPHTFESGDVIRADEMNENFDTLEHAVGAIEPGTPLPTDCQAGDTLTWDGASWACLAPTAPTYEVVSVQSDFDSTTERVVRAYCPEGATGVGGGARVFPSLADANRDTAPIAVRSTTPADSDGDGAPESWIAQATEIGAYAFDWHLTIFVVCAS